MLLIKICCILTILFINFGKTNGIKANMMLNLSKIENIENATIATYDVNITDDTFQLFFEVDDYVVIQDSFEATKIKIGYEKYVTWKIGKSLWNSKMNYHRTKKKLCENFNSYDVDMDAVLNEVFQCQNQVTGYISRFYYIKEEVDVDTLNRVQFSSKISIFWLITHKGFNLLNNDKNYENF